MRTIVIFWFFFIALVWNANTQIIQVTEIVRGNSNEITQEDKPIIDINARLDISVSKRDLIAKIGNTFPEYARVKTLEGEINALDRALRNQGAILSILEDQIHDVDSVAKFVGLTVDFLEIVQQNTFLSERYDALATDFFQNQRSFEEGALDTYILQNLDGDLRQLQLQLEDQKDFRYDISMVAFKRDEQGGDRVHIENFDTYEEREYVTIPRWVTTLSDEQRQQLNDLARIAEENNAKSVRVFDELKEKLLQFLPDTSCVEENKNAFKSFLTDPTNGERLTEALKETGNHLIGKVETYLDFYRAFLSNLEQLTITTSLDIVQQFQVLLQNTNQIQIDINDFNSLVSAISELANEIKGLTNNANQCLIGLKKELNDLHANLRVLMNQQKRYVANRAFGEEVLKFGTNNIPEKGHIKLKGTGPRSNGDELEIAIYLRIPQEGEGATEKRHLLEEQVYTMQLIGVRSEVAVGLIMANPSEDSFLGGNGEREFYYAPSASLLLKFGSRKSYFYNEWLDFGVGLNFASTDFNTDGDPEFGTGLIVTAFRNVLSLGYNYNVALDTPYWFFGVNLPFTIPGLPVNRIN